MASLWRLQNCVPIKIIDNHHQQGKSNQISQPRSREESDQSDTPQSRKESDQCTARQRNRQKNHERKEESREEGGITRGRQRRQNCTNCVERERNRQRNRGIARGLQREAPVVCAVGLQQRPRNCKSLMEHVVACKMKTLNHGNDSSQWSHPRSTLCQ